MKDEIKEILDCIKDRTRDYVGMNGCLYQDLEREELNLLLNYITNLQKENKQLKKKYENAVADYELEKYKNSKAIEYIKSETYWYSQVNSEKELLEILGDKE